MLADYLEHEHDVDADNDSTALFLAAASIATRRPGGRLSRAPSTPSSARSAASMAWRSSAATASSARCARATPTTPSPTGSPPPPGTIAPKSNTDSGTRTTATCACTPTRPKRSQPTEPSTYEQGVTRNPTNSPPHKPLNGMTGHHPFCRANPFQLLVSKFVPGRSCPSTGHRPRWRCDHHLRRNNRNLVTAGQVARTGQPITEVGATAVNPPAHICISESRSTARPWTRADSTPARVPADLMPYPCQRISSRPLR